MVTSLGGWDVQIFEGPLFCLLPIPISPSQMPLILRCEYICLPQMTLEKLLISSYLPDLADKELED